MRIVTASLEINCGGRDKFLYLSEQDLSENLDKESKRREFIFGNLGKKLWAEVKKIKLLSTVWSLFQKRAEWSVNPRKNCQIINNGVNRSIYIVLDIFLPYSFDVYIRVGQRRVESLWRLLISAWCQNIYTEAAAVCARYFKGADLLCSSSRLLAQP